MHDFEQVRGPAAGAGNGNHQPTAIVYRTRKGWQYGVTGKASHGAGHGLCADGFFQALKPFVEQAAAVLPRCASANQRCQAEEPNSRGVLLGSTDGIRSSWRAMVAALAQNLRGAQRCQRANPADPRGSGRTIWRPTEGRIPAELTLTPGQTATLRGELGRVSVLQSASQGAG
jgi:transketolase